MTSYPHSLVLNSYHQKCFLKNRLNFLIFVANYVAIFSIQVCDRFLCKQNHLLTNTNACIQSSQRFRCHVNGSFLNLNNDFARKGIFGSNEFVHGGFDFSYATVEFLTHSYGHDIASLSLSCF